MGEVKAVTPAVNGDVVDKVMSRLRGDLAGGVRRAREHPDEFAVEWAPVLLAYLISAKYRLSFADHMLLCTMAALSAPLLADEYRKWKTTPVSRALRKVS